MENEKLIQIANSIMTKCDSGTAMLTQSLEFFKVYVGQQNSFYLHLQEVPKITGTEGYRHSAVSSILKGYIDYLRLGLEIGISLERKIQIETVSDVLDQAQNILLNKDYHPAAACVLIGAALEEFLRTWVEEIGLLNETLKKSIDTYAKILRGEDFITKQDIKDISSCSGLRNSAAHGHWDDVSDRNKIELMLQLVNIFIRKYSR